MKYLKKYNLFESVVKVREYYINGKNWDYQLGYIWSPAILVGSHGRNDSDVNSVEIEDDGMSNTLANRTVFHLFKEHLGTSNLKDLCEFHLLNLGYAYQPKDEFAFLEEGLLEKRYYVNIRVPGKSDIISQVPNFDGDYLDIVGDLTGHKFTDKERKNIEDGKDSKHYGGSWHINVCLYVDCVLEDMQCI